MKEENQPPSSDIGASQGIVDWVVKCFMFGQAILLVGA